MQLGGPTTERHGQSECRCGLAPRVERAAPPALNGVRIDPVSPDELKSRVGAFLDCGASHTVHFPATHPLVIARRDASYRDLLNRGALNVPDGVGVILGLRLFGHRAQRLVGSDSVRLLAEWGVDTAVRHYFFGGKPAVVEQLRRELEATYPGISIVGAESPPYRPLSETDLQQAGERMREARADLVWVGLGVPKQDLVADRLQALGAAPAILCVGAAFDFLSGAKSRAPRWMQRAGLEWMHRLATEPGRLWRRYLIDNARFVAGTAADFVRLKLGRPA